MFWETAEIKQKDQNGKNVSILHSLVFLLGSPSFFLNFMNGFEDLAIRTKHGIFNTKQAGLDYFWYKNKKGFSVFISKLNRAMFGRVWELKRFHQQSSDSREVARKDVEFSIIL